ncbi:choice-of-anchor I family protein [Aestuariibacter sp. A3R04]|uniref:choice-of-anchor I family protein n=1 Tax=Aestuariibacter sp. A3R04 TaxID=2841571 RepID=UPI001C081B70|nr:choice-of-anchor I family protein [Aestuariibacter sp. A3R04]MBU3021511.1 choice-of-anchor I family protein [Aestuariibacter sp. A3R04]
MLENKFKVGLMALLVTAALSGCSLDGDDGEQGPQGAQGEAGADGADGSVGADGADASLGVSLAVIGRSVVGGEGAAEIVQYHKATQTIYATNGESDTVSVIAIADLTGEAVDSPVSADTLSSTSVTLPTEVNGVALDGLTSIAVKDDLLAVAIPADEKSENGYVLFYTGLNDSTPAFLKAVEVGNLPDNVAFTPDGTKVLTANEGEPSDDYTVDPEGSVSVITINDGVPADSATTLTFEGFNTQQSQLEAMGMQFPNPSGRTINGVTINTTVAMDLEPEYITATNDTAYVTLQENNGLAVVDLTTMTISLIGLGVKDWSGYQIDAQEDGEVSFGQYDGLYGVYMPDTITHTTWKDATFLLTANEGDAREYIFDADDEAACLAAGGEDFDDGDCLAYTDEVKVKDLNAESNSPLAMLQANGEIDDLRVTLGMGDADGDGEYDGAYTYGARSFTIWDQNGQVVFDSGDDFERITASVHGAAFNNGDDENEGDSRSENKGPEPEAITTGKVGDRNYAFIGTERMGGIFVYDITNPYNVTFSEYVINRDLTEGLDVDDGIGDLAPESLVFVPADASPTGEALLVVGNEISGSVTLWQVTAN